MIVDPALGVVGESVHLWRVDRRLHVHLGHTWLQVSQRRVDALARTGPPVVIEVIGEHDSGISCQFSEREAGLLGGDRRGQPHGELEFAGQFDLDVEELGTQRDRREVRGEMGDIDTPRHGTGDLGLQLAEHLFGIGVLPQIVETTRKPALA